MRIALSFPGCYRRGGVERVLLETANHLANAGHEAHLFCIDWDEEALDRRVVRHKIDLNDRLPFARERRFPARCQKAMNATRIPFDAHAAFGVMSPPGGTIWVGSVHAAWLAISAAHRPLSGRLKQKLNPYHHLILRLERRVFGGRRYRKLIALTDRVKQDLIEHYRVPDEDIAVLPNGFSEREFNIERRNHEREKIRSELGYSNSDRVVVFVANETERKGFGPLLQALARLKDPNARLLVVGRIDPATYRAEIDRLGLTDHVQYVGPAADVGRYYAAADVFALPTIYEAWGLVIIEAMACGLPALTSQLAGASEAVQQGTTGELLEDPANVEEIRAKLASLLGGKHANPAAISETVQPYRWHRVLERHEQILAGNETPREHEADGSSAQAAMVCGAQT